MAIRSGPRTPVITLAPTDEYQIAGGDVTFTARGSGLYGVTYQWQSNGVNIAGGTDATGLTNVQAAQAGIYRVVVSNEVGSLASTDANLALVTAPVIVSKPLPTNQAVIFQNNLTLSVVAAAPGQFSGFPLAYQWMFNGTNLSGATSSSYTLYGDGITSGSYSVTVTNAVGSASAYWQVTQTYVGSYIDVGTLAYHLATNAVGRTNGFSNISSATVVLCGWASGTNVAQFTNSIWSTNFWLQGVKGLSATCIGYSNAASFVVSMVSPRHYLIARHVGVGRLIAFLDINKVIYWRPSLQRVDVGTKVADNITPDT